MKNWGKNIQGELPKKAGLDLKVCRFEWEESLGKKSGVVFVRGG